MPIYEYRCLKCNQEFEAMQKFSDSPLKVCPSCGGPVKKLVSRSSFQLKGSGWYLTDYARRKTPNGTNGERKSSDLSSSSESTSESTSTPSSSPAGSSDSD
ncbi:MAG TPA: zinc ribbon domain-containing protein [Deltaproteobacteria bacterium]|nr:zinc ribbon domain-containing protein [Deltaproteobacteria bacterium]